MASANDTNIKMSYFGIFQELFIKSVLFIKSEYALSSRRSSILCA